MTALLLSIPVGCSGTELPYPDDAGADCPSGPEALLNLFIRSSVGPVPFDTKVMVSWSAGAEPPFVLSDKKTWMSLVDGNVICDVDADAPPPKDLAELVCHLWTSGVTHVEVRASGYAPYSQTLKPRMVEACKGPVPTNVGVKLSPVSDAGTGG